MGYPWGMNEITTTTDAAARTELAAALATNPATMYLGGLRGQLGTFAGSQRTQRHGLDRIARMLGGGEATATSTAWASISPAILAAVRARLIEGWRWDGEVGAVVQGEAPAPATMNRLQAALKGVVRAAWTLGQIDAERRERLLAVLKPVKGRREPAGRHIDRGEVVAVFDAIAADETATGARDASIVALLAVGLRRAEVAALDLADVDRTSWAITVRGKGRADRVIFATNGCRGALTDWLEVRGDAEGPLFAPVLKSGRILVGQGVSATTVSSVMARRTAEAGIAAATPHDLRRTYAGEMLEGGVDLVTVQGILGHASPATTSRYDRRGLATRQRAMETVCVPYRRRRHPAA
jgi:integrase